MDGAAKSEAAGSSDVGGEIETEGPQAITGGWLRERVLRIDTGMLRSVIAPSTERA